MKMRYVLFGALLVLLSVPSALAANPKTLTVEASPVHFDGIPRGATRIVLLPLTLTASCDGTIHVNELHVTRFGLADSADIAGVYILRDGVRLTRRMKFSSDDQSVTLRPRSLTLPSCGTVSIDIAIDLQPDAASGNRLSLMLATPADMVTDAESVLGKFPLQTNDSLAEVTPAPLGNLSVTFHAVGSIVPVRDAVLAEFAVEAQGDTHQLLRSITLTNQGSAKNADLRKLFLSLRNGRALTPVVQELAGDRVTLVFTRPFPLRRGQTAVFQLMGQAWRRVKTVSFTLEEPTDLHAEPLQRLAR
jgi:hypothetical protein